MGLASIEENSPHRKPTTSIPRYVFICSYSLRSLTVCSCNEPPPFPSFFGMTHANQVHVSDLRVLLTGDLNHSSFKTVGFFSPVSQNGEPFYAGLGLFEMALDEWLECF